MNRKIVGRIIYYFTEGFPQRSEYPFDARGIIRYLSSLLTIWPIGLSRIFKLQPLFSLSSGLLVLLLFKKGFENIPITIAFVIIAFFYITFRLYLFRGKGGLLTAFWDTGLIFLLNNLLLFVLPFYLETTSFPSRNMIFAPLIIAMTIIASWFSIYTRLVANHPLRSSLFYAFTFFCVLNLIFPILFGMRNIWSLLLAGIIASTAAVLFIYPHIDIVKNRKSRGVFLLGLGLFFVLIWFGRSLIPPAPLKLTRTVACGGIENFRPSEPFHTAKASETRDVFFYSSIFAPRGLSEKIHHLWFHNNRKLFSVSVSKIQGGRKEGFGTWSQHTINEGPGKYTVEVWTDGGQLLGGGKFTLY